MSNLVIQRTDSQNPHFAELVKKLDSFLSVINGDKNSFFVQFNKIDSIKNVIVAFSDGRAVGCGAIRAFDTGSMEVKRMYVLDEYRGKGVATRILTELEIWALELGFKKCILETAATMTEAIALYTKNNYHQVENYGQYKEVASSRCFEKDLTSIN